MPDRMPVRVPLTFGFSSVNAEGKMRDDQWWNNSMNQNDMDRYLWRTGQQWSGDDRTSPESFRGLKSHGRAIFFVALGFILTLVGLVLMR
jgi:hypothetical protein